MKFIGHLGKFDNLENFDSPFEFNSKLNDEEDGEKDGFNPASLPSADEAFGSSMNSPSGEDDVPF